MNDTSAFRRVAATLTIGSFSVAALMGIAALLGGGDFGEGEGRVLLTTLVVGCASICMLCYLSTAGTPWAAAGVTGAVVLVLPTVSALTLVWSDWSGDEDGLLKAFGVGVVCAVTLAQVCLLLGVAGARERLGPLLGTTVVLALVVAAVVSALILGGLGADGVWRLLGVAAILDVLGTLVTIALAKFGGRDEQVVPGYDGRTRVSLSADRARALGDLAARTGRSRDDLVAEAIDRFLSAPVG
jgi:hypothetical protein